MFATDKVLYEAIDGIGIINLNVPQHPAFTQAMNDFAGDQELQGDYILRHDNTEFLNSYNLSAHTTVALSEQQLYFDAVISLGLAACNVSTEYGPFFSGPQLYNEWLRTEFLGVSGKVQFDPLTGTRTDGVEYGIFNIVADPETSKYGDFRFSSNQAQKGHYQGYLQVYPQRLEAPLRKKGRRSKGKELKRKQVTRKQKESLRAILDFPNDDPKFI